VDFPPVDEVAALGSSEYECGFLRNEFGPGMGYYRRRLERLQFAGECVLDAGCGAGQWSLALAERFDEVHALDRSEDRLRVLRTLTKQLDVNHIHIRSGSVDNLPYEANKFDAVFCYGVIMFTDVAAVLREFHRVLKPGGRMYLCLNAEGWSRHLAEEASKNDPKLRKVGFQTLLDTAVQRLTTPTALELLREAYSNALPIETRAGRRLRFLLMHSPRRAWRWLIRQLLGVTRQVYYVDYLAAHCGQEWAARALDTIAGILLNGDPVPSRAVTRAYTPEEINLMCSEAGFVDFEWDSEAGLLCDLNDEVRVEPRYIGRYSNELAVWECLAVKPSGRQLLLSPSRLQSRSPSRVCSYVECTPQPIMSNASWHGTELGEWAERQARRLGGHAQLESLAGEIVAAARTEEEKLRAILRFVQGVVRRDPLIQPMLSDGMLPSSLAIILTGTGRCGHCCKVVQEIADAVGIEARCVQRPKHLLIEARVDGRWVVADADVFKNGIMLENREGKLLAVDELRQNPFQVDRFMPTGWFILPSSPEASGLLGRQVRGYVDAAWPERRGFASGYFSDVIQYYPPSLPQIECIETASQALRIRWTASHVREGRLVGYRVAVSTSARGWAYGGASQSGESLPPPPDHVFKAQTTALHLETDVPAGAKRLYVSVTPISDHIDREPDAFFWPSEEEVYEF
jgi:ubiquinone/menaquinone biosynthesis C-methylase UbiE